MTDVACDCPECRAMCTRRPCWPTPADAERLVAAGFGRRLMREWWFDHSHEKTVFLLTPALAGREGGESPVHPAGPCTFLTADGLCELHAVGLKPSEGRRALCHNRTPVDLHQRIGQTWNNAEALALVQRWLSQAKASAA
jgi:hypothetical protein